MCQATYLMMGENLYEVIPKPKEKIFSCISEMQKEINTDLMKHSTITVR